MANEKRSGYVEVTFPRVTNQTTHSLNVLTGVLLLLVIVLAGATGSLYTKVSYLQQTAKVVPTPTLDLAQANNAPALGLQITPTPGVVNVDVGNLPVLGDANAKVTVIEFADFRCPYCEQFYRTIEPTLISDYVNTGKVKFAFRNFAFLDPDPKNKISTWAAEAAECANDQGKFWDFHNWLYSNQASESDMQYYTKDNLVKYAGNVGLDTTAFQQCLTSDKYAQAVADDKAAGAAAGVSATPTMFINGHIIVGAVPYDQFKAALDNAVNSAK